MRSFGQLIVAGIFSVFVLTSDVYAGGIPVFDGSNLAQNILTAARELKSNLNEALMIKNQITSIQNEIKNLAKLNFNILDEYSDDLQKLFQQMGSVHGLMQNLNNLQSKFEELYPDFNNQADSPSLEKVSETMNQTLNVSREMMLGASKTGAQVLRNLPKTEQQLEELLVDSHSSVGILQAAQAGNQITATVSSNLMNLNALMANFTQAHMSYMQKQNTGEAIQLERAKHVLEGESPSTEPPVPFAGS